MPDKEYFVHHNAIVETEDIGKDTRIWAFTHVMKNVSIGEDCNICDHSFVESGVTIGSRVVIKNGIAIWEGVTIEDDVFLGPYCVFTNDMYPRSKAHQGVISTLVKKGASIGANSTIICGITLGKYCMIGAGSVVTRSVPDFALVMGNPARVKYWISKAGEKLIFNGQNLATDKAGNSYKLNSFEDKSKNFVEFI